VAWRDLAASPWAVMRDDNDKWGDDRVTAWVLALLVLVLVLWADRLFPF
jgi:hypothetical protein